MQAQFQDNFEFPAELSIKSQALVGISGLDTRNNAVHKSIWETFTGSKRAESLPVVYKHIDNAYEFPVVKPKRNSYEWYIPKGILKKNWMDKHLNKIPSVIAIFYDLDWGDAQWSEKMIECASRVQSLRVALEGRNTKLCVVLIQNKQPLPPGEDPLATERAVALCSSCELNNKALFILPHGDHLPGYASRLETAFYEMAQTYYHGEIRNVKSHREHLNKNNHQYLFIRHQFKMGFLNEMKQDTHTAHKHYTYAYNNLLEIRIVDTNAMEIRTVAGFINYKLCRLMFALNLARDAISQFKTFTERFKTRLGFQELSFEHYAWMSKQFSIFGDIFDEAVKQGLPAMQTQHPGLYYQQAVQYATLRKKACEDLCSSVTVYPSPDPLEGMLNMEFYGQRPWRPGKVSAEPPDPQIEYNGIKALQFLEKQVNHSAIIIALYGLAVAQFKSYRCPRTRRHLIVQMADEYYNCGDYGKALTLLTHMLWDYRTECWWGLLTHILETALKCAYLTARLDDYIVLALELLGGHTTINQDSKKRIFDNLNRILRKQVPEPEPSVPQTAETLWKDKFKPPVMNLPIDLNNIIPCIDCKVRFLQKKYQADEKIQLEIYVKNSCSFPMNFMKIMVTVNNPTNSNDYVVDQTLKSNPNLLFNGHEVKKYLIEFLPNPSDINKELQVSSVNLFLGCLPNHMVDLKFSGLGNDKNIIPIELLHFKNTKDHSIDFLNTRPSITTLIVPRISKLTMKFEHAKPALISEWYKIDIHMLNEKDCLVSNLEFTINLADDEGVDSTEFSLKSDGLPQKLPIVFRLPDLPPSEETVIKLYTRSEKVGECNISIKATFNLLNEEKIPSLMEDIIHVSIVKPFEVSTKFLSTLFDDIQKFYVDEDFVIMPTVNCLSPWPIVIEDTQLEFEANVKSVDEGIKCQVAGVKLTNGESAAEMYLACTTKRSDSPINVGTYTVKWKRVNGQTTINKIPITGVPVDWIPLELKINVPSHGLVRTPMLTMLIEYHLINKSQHLINCEVSLEGSEAFMFAGYKQFQSTILPNSRKVLKYNLYPLIAGSVALPKLVLNIPDMSPGLRQEQINALLRRTLPTHIFVMPKMKGTASIPAVIKSANF